MACDSDPARLPELLDRIQESRADALAEMRILVSELRLRREVLRTIFSIDGEERGTVGLKETLLRVVQESLNNVVKHAGVAEAEVSLSFGEAEVVLRVRDAGQGFDGSAAGGTGAARGGIRPCQHEGARRGGWRHVADCVPAGQGDRDHGAHAASRGKEHDGQEPAHQSPGR